MKQYSSEYQPARRPGRPKGSKNRKSLITEGLLSDAIEQWSIAINKGESWAIKCVLDRMSPTLKPNAQSGSAEHDLLLAQTELARLRAFEISELEQRLAAVEERLDEE